jgi:hypothetical protein
MKPIAIGCSGDPLEKTADQQWIMIDTPLQATLIRIVQIVMFDKACFQAESIMDIQPFCPSGKAI